MAETADRIVIIGGGASGLMAAIQASQAGVAVTILEHKDRVGKKILMTGNGKCNLTNISVELLLLVIYMENITVAAKK